MWTGVQADGDCKLSIIFDQKSYARTTKRAAKSDLKENKVTVGINHKTKMQHNKSKPQLGQVVRAQTDTNERDTATNDISPVSR